MKKIMLSVVSAMMAATSLNLPVAAANPHKKTSSSGYGADGRACTRGKRHRSQMIRANRRKAKRRT